MGKQVTRERIDYEGDFHAWADDQARKLRNGLVHEADLDNIAEELEGLSRSERRALESSLRLIVLHMLKLVHQPERATQSWRNTINRERLNVEQALEDMPSLRRLLPELYEKAYRDGRRLAILETGLFQGLLPEDQEFSLEEVRRIGFIPQGSVWQAVTVGDDHRPPRIPPAGQNLPNMADNESDESEDD